MRNDRHPTIASPAAGEEAASLRALNDGVYTAFQTQLRESFLKDAPQILAAIRDQLKGFVKGESRAAMQSHLTELGRIVQLLCDNARIAGSPRIARMTGALAAFLGVLRERPETINLSTVRTTTHTVDFLAQLVEYSAPLEAVASAPPLILVVDDETGLASLVCTMFQQADLRAMALDDPEVALRVLHLNPFDLIFLDIAMPGMDGFEVCSKLRALPAHKQTPVVFLTGLADFENRAQSILKGGNDLIAKPFLPAELIVKALTYIYKSQLHATGQRK